MAKYVIAIVGPTAIGKTARAIALAIHFETEIVSTDSRQFFKEMYIGTAVPSPWELKQVKHHFIQQLSIFDSYSVGDFERDTLLLLDKLFRSHDVVLLVVGSGLYMDAVLYGLDHFPETDPSLRHGLNAVFNKDGIGALQDRLQELDPDYYAKVDLENPHRLIRALEISISSGRPYSSFLAGKKKERGFTPILIGIEAERKIIYERINRRVDKMMENGLLEEARELFKHSTLNALNTVGYKELFAYFEGKITLEKAVGEIKKNTRRFAKRQLTWYRKNEHLVWLDHTLSDTEFIGRVELLLRERSHA